MSVPRLGGQNGEQALCHLEHTGSWNSKAREANVGIDQVQYEPAIGSCIVLKCVAEVYLKRVSVTWTRPLSDHNRTTAKNEFALPVLANLMGTQKCATRESP